MQKGTLYQLRNVLNRRNVSSSVKSNVAAYEDFLELVTKGRISAALEVLQLSSTNEMPRANMNPSIWMDDDACRKRELDQLSAKIVERYVDLAPDFTTPKTSEKGTVHAYACEMLGLGLLLEEFRDAVREGDGDRVLLVWKYFMLMFKASRRRNYAIEAFNLLVNYNFILPPYIAEQLKWSRFINSDGGTGNNVSMDLHMEHLNRQCKAAISSLGANKTEKAMVRVGKTLGVIVPVTANFDSQNSVCNASGSHSSRSSRKDLDVVVRELCDIKAFKAGQPSMHKSFKNLTPNLIRTLDENETKKWITDKITEII